MVYRLSKAASGWALNVLRDFTGGANGSTPEALVLGANGVLYGTANGGTQNCNGGYCGFTFSLQPYPTVCLTSLCSWRETVLYSFTGTTDAWAGGDLVSDHAGNLYGVSESGGAQGKGAVFELTSSLQDGAKASSTASAEAATAEAPRPCSWAMTAICMEPQKRVAPRQRVSFPVDSLRQRLDRGGPL